MAGNNSERDVMKDMEKHHLVCVQPLNVFACSHRAWSSHLGLSGFPAHSSLPLVKRESDLSVTTAVVVPWSDGRALVL